MSILILTSKGFKIPSKMVLHFSSFLLHCCPWLHQDFTIAQIRSSVTRQTHALRAIFILFIAPPFFSRRSYTSTNRRSLLALTTKNVILVYLFKILFYVNDYFSYRKKNSATRFKYSLIHTNRYLSYIFLDTCFNLQRSVIAILVAKVISQT